MRVQIQEIQQKIKAGLAGVSDQFHDQKLHVIWSDFFAWMQHLKNGGKALNVSYVHWKMSHSGIASVNLINDFISEKHAVIARKTHLREGPLRATFLDAISEALYRIAASHMNA